MTQTQLIWLGVGAILAFWMLGAHNRMVELRNAIGTVWTQIDELLKRRQQLLPELLTLLRTELPNEHGTLDAVLAASVQASGCADTMRHRPSAPEHAASLVRAESQLGAALTRLLALVDLQRELAGHSEVAPRVAELRELESKLGFARHAYNQAATVYDEAARQFPTRLLRRLFGFGAAGRL
jgi:LemA protein